VTVDAASLTDDDRQRLVAIMEATTPEALVQLVFAYYHDADRADRTSRPQMYLHMGMLAGAVMRALDTRQPVSRGTSQTSERGSEK
jgi:hypothetical protein